MNVSLPLNFTQELGCICDTHAPLLFTDSVHCQQLMANCFEGPQLVRWTEYEGKEDVFVAGKQHLLTSCSLLNPLLRTAGLL